VKESGPVAVSELVYRRQVQFAETDASGIVHFTSFFRYMEEAEHALWRAAGLSIAERDAPVGFPRVAASCEFRKPLKFEDEFEVHLRVAAKTSKTFRYVALLRKDGELIAEGSITAVCVRRVSGEKPVAVDIPEEISARFVVAAAAAATER
jgi:YbgC/YbaW family acyl-CoA thioester hydrolase